MAIAVVKATKIQSGTSSANTAVSATAGNALIVGGGTFVSGVWTVTRTGDTYTTDASGVDANSVGNGIASAPNVAGGSVTCTISSTSSQGISGWALELSGLPTSAIRDATSPTMATGVSTTPLSSALTNATADAIYVCAFGFGSGDTTITVGSGYTNVVSAVTMAEAQGSIWMVGGLEYQIVSSTASRTAGWTCVGSWPWSTNIAVYKALASAVTTLPLIPSPTRIRFLR